MNIDIPDHEPTHQRGESAMRLIAPRWPRHAALFVLAHRSAPRPLPCRARPVQRPGAFALSMGAQAPMEPQRSPLPGTPIGARSGASNCGFQDDSSMFRYSLHGWLSGGGCPLGNPTPHGVGLPRATSGESQESSGKEPAKLQAPCKPFAAGSSMRFRGSLPMILARKHRCEGAYNADLAAQLVANP
jgi:hypothetical protein